MKGTKLPTISKIIESHGGLESLKDSHYIRIENEPYMRLVIERIGDFDQMPLISIAHYYEQNGDQMRDPEMTFAVSGYLNPRTGKAVPYYFPVTFQQDGGVGFYQEAMFHDESGKSLCRPALLAELSSFARQWDHNIKEQGFADVN